MFLVGLLLLQGFDVQISTDLCGNLIALCPASNDVHILARGKGKVVLGRDEGRGVSGKSLFAVAVGFIRANTDIRQSLRGKGCTDACRAEFVLCCGDTCILTRFKAHVFLGGEGDVISRDDTALDGQVMLTRSDVCTSTRCDTASRVFVGCALHAVVGFACPEADIEGEGLTREGIFLERIVNHAPRLVGVGGFESVVLYLADTADRCIERLSEIKESVTEADGESCRLAACIVLCGGWFIYLISSARRVEGGDFCAFSIHTFLLIELLRLADLAFMLYGF